MFKFNRVRWLHINKISLFFVQVLYVALTLTMFLALVMYPNIPTNGLTYTISAYVSDVVDNLVIKNFKLDPFFITMMTFITIFYFSFMILAYFNNRWFKFDNYKYKKIMYLNMIVYSILITLSFIFVFSQPNIPTLDIKLWLTQSESKTLLNTFFIMNIKNLKIEYTFSNEGIIIITIYSILLFISVVVLLLVIKKVIDHKFF